MKRIDPLDGLQIALNYRFSNITYLHNALIHSSHAYEEGLPHSNERLEFLGDAVLHLVLTEYIMELCKDNGEGLLSALRSYCESAPFISEIAAGLHLGDYLLLGRGEISSGGKYKESLLEDAMEAVIASVYLDGGYEAASAFILHHFVGKINIAYDEALYMDSKTELQKLTQKRYNILPIYTVIGEYGLEHEKTFRVKASVQTSEREVSAEGTGRNKKLAEKDAARKLLKNLI